MTNRAKIIGLILILGFMSLLAVVGLIILLPSILRLTPEPSGGMMVTLALNKQRFVDDFWRRHVEELRREAPGAFLLVDPEARVLTIRNPDERQKEVVQDWNAWNVVANGQDLVLSLRKERVDWLAKRELAASPETLIARFEDLGLWHAKAELHPSKNQIELRLPGFEDVARLEMLVGKRELALCLAKSEVAPRLQIIQDLGAAIPAGSRLLPFGKGEDGFILIDPPLFTSRDIADARKTWDDRGVPALGLQLNEDAARAMKQVSQANIGKQLCIVFDEKILSAPVIMGPLSGSFIIQASFTEAEIESIVSIMKSGPVPPMDVIQVDDITH